MSKHLHDRLHLTFAELGALLATREMLVRGLLVHEEIPDVVPGQHTFNMSVPCRQEDCGTVTCIGGTMALIMGCPPGTYVDCSPPHLRALFYPEPVFQAGVKSYRDITVKQSIMAIDNFLLYGKPRWLDVVKATTKRPAAKKRKQVPQHGRRKRR